MQNFTFPIFGGILIGIAVSLMLYLNGRVTGVSGIIGGSLRRTPGDFLWRLCFILGLIMGGFLLKVIYPESLVTSLHRSHSIIVLAGLLVGFGTSMGGGCTSGHGICGVARLSPRSWIATLIFMSFGMLSATWFDCL